MKKIIGRETETELLKQYINSSKSEFIAVFGRRRVGKTYLIDQLFGITERQIQSCAKY